MASKTIQTFEIKISGPVMLMHNPQLADPLNEHTKALKDLTKRRKKSDEDHIAIMATEFQGGLYYDDVMGPCIPGHMLDAVIESGARKSKLGKVFKSCVRTTDDMYQLAYKGPRKREDLWADPRFRDVRGVKVGTARVMRTRPKFKDWSVTFKVSLFPCELNPDDIENALRDGGMYAGIGDGRPRFGLFQVDSFKEL